MIQVRYESSLSSEQSASITFKIVWLIVSSSQLGTSCTAYNVSREVDSGNSCANRSQFYETQIRSVAPKSLMRVSILLVRATRR